MSYNGSGTFNINTAGQPVVTGTVITSTAFNLLTADLASGLTTALTKDGQTTPTANIPMGTFKLTGLGAGTAATDAAQYGQLQAGATQIATVTGTDTFVGTLSPALGAYAAGNLFSFVAPNTNTGASTINLNSLGAKGITKLGSTALAAGDIVSGRVYLIEYDGTRFQLINPSASSVTSFSAGSTGLTPSSAFTGAVTLAGTLATTNGGTGLTSFTANGVVYASSTSALATGSALTFDGTNFSTTGSATGTAFIPSGSTVPTNGMYLPTTNSVAWSTNTTERMRLDSSGNLGLGVTPSAWVTAGSTKILQVSTQSSFGEIYNATVVGNNWYYDGADKRIKSGYATRYSQTSDTGIHAWYNAPSGTAGNAITFTQALTLDASGNLLVGTTANIGSARIYVLGSVADSVARIYNSSATTPSGVIVVYSGAAPNNTGSEFLYCSDTGALRASIRSNGGIANYAANNVILSDRREKTNFAPAKSYLETICAIPVQTFNYIDQNMEDDGGLTLGVVAQDVQAVAPELVSESNWGTKDQPKMRLEIYQNDLQYALMKCIQEQQALIESLTTRLTALEGKA